ncbi:MAG: type II toxin-antitoxin system VapC family toxin [Candidatus Latescibacteria bacterium]|nr:type II toxin-antitoxin system VapC family toxin [Candidatus Latescibacterota bacterium]
MSYLLDTDICIYWLNGREEIKRKVKEVGENDLNMAIITLGELRYGAYYSERGDRNLKRIDDFLGKIKVIPLNEASMDKFGQIKADLRRQGKVIEDLDMLIASVAIVKDCILVTNNTNHFKRISGLKLENWLI